MLDQKQQVLGWSDNAISKQRTAPNSSWTQAEAIRHSIQNKSKEQPQSYKSSSSTAEREILMESSIHNQTCHTYTQTKSICLCRFNPIWEETNPGGRVTDLLLWSSNVCSHISSWWNWNQESVGIKLTALLHFCYGYPPLDLPLICLVILHGPVRQPDHINT